MPQVNPAVQQLHFLSIGTVILISEIRRRYSIWHARALMQASSYGVGAASRGVGICFFSTKVVSRRAYWPPHMGRRLEVGAKAEKKEKNIVTQSLGVAKGSRLAGQIAAALCARIGSIYSCYLDSYDCCAWSISHHLLTSGIGNTEPDCQSHSS